MSNTIKLGIRFIEYLGDIHQIVDYAVMAEQAGLDYVWFPHDIFMKSTWVVTSAVAMATSTIRIGSIGTNPYTTDPAEIASYLASLDELSRGRAVIGIGLHTTIMLEWAGVDCQHVLRRTKETIAMVKVLLNGETVECATDEFRWNEQCYLRFKPLSRNVPIYVCAFGKDYLALSGEIGGGSLPMLTPPASAEYMVASIKSGLKVRSEKNPDFDIAGCAWLSLSEDGKAAEQKMRMMIAYFGPYLEQSALQTIGLNTFDFDDIRALVKQGEYQRAQQAVTAPMMKLGLSGTPHQVIGQIEELADHGITQISLGGPLGPDVRKAITLLGSKIVPHFKH